MMDNLHILRPAALEASEKKRSDDAQLLRNLADAVQAGTVTDVVAISRSPDSGYEVLSTTDKWSTVALARCLDAWAVQRMFV